MQPSGAVRILLSLYMYRKTLYSVKFCTAIIVTGHFAGIKESVILQMWEYLWWIHFHICQHRRYLCCDWLPWFVVPLLWLQPILSFVTYRRYRPLCQAARKKMIDHFLFSLELNFKNGQFLEQIQKRYGQLAQCVIKRLEYQYLVKYLAFGNKNVWIHLTAYLWHLYLCKHRASEVPHMYNMTCCVTSVTLLQGSAYHEQGMQCSSACSFCQNKIDNELVKLLEQRNQNCTHLVMM